MERLLAILFYFILIDSGGPIGIRYLSFTYFILLGLYNICLKKFPYSYIILNSIIGIVFFLNMVISAFNNISLPIYLSHSLYMIMIAFFSFAFISFRKETLLSSLLLAGNIFIFTIFLTYVVLLFNIPFISAAIKGILSNFPGWFYLKSFMGIPFVQVYFQATLSLVPIALIALFKSKYKTFTLYIFVLFICSSDFGVLTLLLLGIGIKIIGSKKISYFISKYFFILSLALLSIFSLYYLSIDNYVFSYSSLIVRIGHLKSIFDGMDIKEFLLGSGTGSSFYSLGHQGYVDNTELTQISYLRKNGIISYIIYYIYIGVILLKLHNKREYSMVLIVISFVFVSLSNPVLTSITFAILLGVSMTTFYKPKIIGETNEL